MNQKELREFIKSHEMGYYVNDTYIHKAFKVKLPDGQYWIWLRYGDTIEVVTKNKEKYIFLSKAKAKTCAEKARNAIKEKNEKEKKQKKDELKSTIKFLQGCHRWQFTNYKNNIKSEYEPLIDEIVRLFDYLPKKCKTETEDGYHKMLEQYIKTGVFLSQGMAFKKEHIVSIKYGEDGSVQIELTNGQKITPVSRNFTKLIKVVFGDNYGGWTYNNIGFPKGDHDLIEI